MTTKGLLLASSAALAPFSSILFFAALGIGGVFFAFAFANEFGVASNEPSRCPACQRDALLLLEAGSCPAIPMLHCRNCNEAYYWTGGTLIRDNGRSLF